MVRQGLKIGLLVALFFAAMVAIWPPSSLRAQIVYELSCPAGSQPINSGAGITFNPSTGKYRANICVDGNGTITQNVGGSTSPGGANTNVQFNNSNAFGGNAGFVYNGSAVSPVVTISGSSNSGQIILGAGNGSAGASVMFGSSGPSFTADSSNNIKASGGWTFTTVAFASLGSVPAAGVGTKYCTDCTTAATCAGAGSGHLAISNGTNWTCQ